MKLEMFFEKFELFAEAPGAVVKMRELVLHLAVRGKLVPQLPEDENAGKLIARIIEIKEKNGESVSFNTSTSDAWHEVPSSWQWVHLGFLGDIIGGGTPKSDNPEYFSDNGIPWLTPADLNGYKGKQVFRGRRYLTELGLKESSARLLPKGSVLFSSRAPIGYVAIAGRDLATNQGFKSCVPHIKEVNQYLYYFLMSAAKRIDHEASGTTFREVSGKTVSQILVPLPPIAEQNRIVAKVDELMALCDRLEEQQQEREAKRTKIARSSLTRFAEAPTPANLTSLFHSSYAITPTDLRKSILALAVQGKIVAQDPSDEPAVELLQRLIAFKQENPLSGRSGRSKENTAQLKPGSDEFPATWVKTTIGEILYVIRGASPRPKGDPLYFSETRTPYHWVKISDIRKHGKNGLLMDTDEYLTEAGMRKSVLLPKGTLVLTNSATIGIPIVLGIEGCCIHDGYLAFPNFPHDLLDQKYLLYLFHTLKKHAESNARGLAQLNLNTDLVRSFPFGLPPLAEQRRIVAKVGELMAMIDQLEVQMEKSKKTSAALLDAAIHELLNPREQAAVDRTGIGCHVVHMLADRKTFGRTALAKFAYLAETHVGLTFNGQYLREAAGPLDPWIYRFEEEAARECWFTFEDTSIRDGNRKIVYRKGEALKAKACEAVAALPKAQHDELDRILKLLGGKPTEEVEIIATLFAVWNDFLIDGHSPSEEDIVTGFREQWHEKKQKFTAKSLHTWLDWMRRNGLMPTGRGPRTQQHSKLDFH